MWEAYENKSFNTIKQDIKKEFKRIESSKRWRYRDDQEIYEAWENIISRYISQLSNANWMRVSNEKWWVRDWKAELVKSANLYKWEALKYFRDAKARFSKRWSEVLKEHWTLWMYITSSSENEQQIHDVAKAINTAEEAALKKIKMVCNPKQEQHNAEEDSSVVRDRQWTVKVKNWEIERQKPLFTQSRDGTLTFTDRTNPLKINQALGNLFKNKDKVYKIDYSKCTNWNIKAKMQNTIWWLSCWIKYDKNSQTYVLTDKSWKILSKRALVWEWVTLKQDTIIENQAEENGWEWMTHEERSSLEQLRSVSAPFEFDANNYRYYEQYSAMHGNICSSYAYWVVSDILAKKWRCFTAPEVSAWDIANSSYIKNNFDISIINDNNPQQQIVDAPAWTFFTVKFDRTSHQDRWVSHVMVSLWNGVYTDLFWPHIRKIDFKSATKFSWKKFTYWWWSYTITDSSRLMSPRDWNFSTWEKDTIRWENLTPEELTKKVHEVTGANENYIRSLIAKENNIDAGNFWKKYDSLSVNIISKKITDLKLDNSEWSNDVANRFLESIKENKQDIMRHYPNLSNHEYDEIAKRAMWILYQESDAGDSTKYWGLWWIGWKEWSVPLYWMLISAYKWIRWEERSRWYTQVKYNSIFSQSDKDFLTNFDIKDWSDLTTPEKCWVWTMVWLISNYNNTIIPMKRDPFWRNDAEIIELKFNDWERESIARWKTLRQADGSRRPRTEEEIQAKINEWSNEHWWIKSQETIVRAWIKNDNDFFDFLYYTWNKPSEITYWTATPSINNYIAQSNWYVREHTRDEPQNA